MRLLRLDILLAGAHQQQLEDGFAPINSERGSSIEDNSGLLLHYLSAGELLSFRALHVIQAAAQSPDKKRGISLSILVCIVVSLAILKEPFVTSILEQVATRHRPQQDHHH